MRIHRCYYDQTLSPGHSIHLKGVSAHHLISVLRVKKGDHLILFNGDLYEYRCQINKIARLDLELCILDKTFEDRRDPRPIHLGQSIIKNHPMDWLLQKATELGVASITPLWSEYTSISLNAERLFTKITHWKNILIQASEQCGRTDIPTLHPPIPLNQWIATRAESTRFCLDPYATQHLHDIQCQASSSIALLIGPEGGLSPIEVAEAKQYDFQTVKISPRILRSETAALAALAVLQKI